MKNRIEKLLKANNNKEFEKRYGKEKSDITRVPKQAELALGDGPEGMALSKEFSLAEVLTVTTGILMIPKDKFGGVAELLEYLEGVSIVKHAKTPKDALSRLSVTADSCKEWISEQHPWIEKLKVPKDNYKGWLEALKISHGENLTLKPKPISKVGWIPPTNIFWEEPSDSKGE
jgi:hypothetical protein